jgi:hypothetical protein
MASGPARAKQLVIVALLALGAFVVGGEGLWVWHANPAPRDVTCRAEERSRARGMGADLRMPRAAGGDWLRPRAKQAEAADRSGRAREDNRSDLSAGRSGGTVISEKSSIYARDDLAVPTPDDQRVSDGR